jgi:hypothetical protein
VTAALGLGRAVAGARWTASVGVGVGAARAVSGTAMLISSHPTAAVNDRRISPG